MRWFSLLFVPLFFLDGRVFADELDLSHHSNYLACVESATAQGTVGLQALVSRATTTLAARNQ